MFQVASDPCYQAIAQHYGERTTQRSGVRLINHINEGLTVLAKLNASDEACQAYCLHPLIQDDEALKLHWKELRALPGDAVTLAMEYRRIANAYLSTRKIASIDEIELSPIADVNTMLIADKIQNRKDFEAHHAQTHPRAAELAEYFANWMRRLNVSEDVYREMLKETAAVSELPFHTPQKIDGEFRNEIGNIYRTAKRMRQLELENQIPQSIASRGFQHAISPKLCESVGIDPDEMIVFTRTRENTESFLEMENRIEAMSLIIPLKMRLWMAYRDMAQAKFGKKFSRPLLKFMKEKYFNDGDYPDIEA